MTDLKELLDDAAGPEPAVTDTDLATDLARGRRALLRRRITGIAGGAVATALVIGAGWSILPSGAPTEISPGPAGHALPTPTPSLHTVSRPADDRRDLPPVPSTPVPLVANTKPFPGEITCDLIPQGWAVNLVGTKQNGDPSQQDLYDPKLRNPAQYRASSTYVRIRASQLMDEGQGLTADKYSEPWTTLWNVRAGTNEAVITSPLGAKDPNGRREVFVRQGKTVRVVVVSNNAYNLGWDAKTLLRFAGSCHYKK